MKVKASVTLPGELLEKIDRVNPDRSAFLEQASRMYLDVAAKHRRDRPPSSTGTRNA